MAEDLFLMQRYWGSEDEKSGESDEELVHNFSPTIKNSLENGTSENKSEKRKKSKFENSEVVVNKVILPSAGNIRKDSVSKNHSIESDKLVNKSSPNKEDSLENGSSIIKPRKRKNRKSECSETDSSPKVSGNSTSEKLDSMECPVISKKKLNASKQETRNNYNSSSVSNGLSGNSEGNFQTIGQVKEQVDEKVTSILPKWLSNPTMIQIDLNNEKTSIFNLPYLDKCSLSNLENSGIKYLFPVQHSVIPWLMQTNEQRLSIRPSDICVSAPTGSGKTLSFVLPIVQSLKSRVVSAVRAVVVLPVSELAIQVFEVFKTYVRGTDLKVILLTGKKSFESEQKNLVKKGIRKYISLVDIIVTTPGRFTDHIYKTEGFCLWQLKYLVIDEADSLMNTIQAGWLKTVEQAVRQGCRNSSCVCCTIGTTEEWEWFNPFECQQSLQKLLFSATLSRDPEKLHTLSLYKPKLFTAAAEPSDWIGKCPLPENLKVQAIVCKEGTKPLVLCHYLKTKHFKRVLCFTESVERAQRLHFILKSMGVEVREITSNNKPVQRKIILQQFVSGKVTLLVCSDMVARGIDIENVDCVVSYDVPMVLKTYIHRIGRTARAGKTGIGLTLLTEGEKVNFFKSLEATQMKLPEIIEIRNSDLEAYVCNYQKALNLADSQKRELKKGKTVFKSAKKPNKTASLKK